MKYFCFSFSLLFAAHTVCLAQINGCTDPQATNFQSNATLNDGSCIYPATSFSPLQMINPLPAAVSETSGLIYWNGLIWTHNDSGGLPALYALDTLSGNISQTVIIASAANTDWEDITQDSTRIYIGDFGNNNGNRTDLKIFIIEKADILTSVNDTVAASLLEFSYEDQTDFSPAYNNNNFDCEAMIAYGDSLLLFSKNWADQKCKIYSLPKTAGNYTARLIDSLDSGALITGACYNPQKNEILLTAYQLGQYTLSPVLWLLFDFPAGKITAGNKRKIDILAAWHQIEAIERFENDRYIMSNELLQQFPLTIQPKLFSFSSNIWTDPLTSVKKNEENEEQYLPVSISCRSSKMVITFNSSLHGKTEIQIFDLSGRLMLEQQLSDPFSGQEIILDMPSAGIPFFLVRVSVTGRTIMSKNMSLICID